MKIAKLLVDFKKKDLIQTHFENKMLTAKSLDFQLDLKKITFCEAVHEVRAFLNLPLILNC
jgi:hypothetical protein